jgi:hypothetical protein
VGCDAAWPCTLLPARVKIHVIVPPKLDNRLQEHVTSQPRRTYSSFDSSRCKPAKLLCQLKEQQEPGSSVSIVSDYGLDDQAIKIRSPVGAEDFSSSPCVQTSSVAHPASCTMGGGPFHGAKRGRGVTLTTHPI